MNERKLLNFRVPVDLAREFKTMAVRESRTMTEILTAMVEEYVHGRD